MTKDGVDWAAEETVGTRQSLHAVAEQVLAGPQHRASGTIRLRVTPAGFATVAEPGLAVTDAELEAPDGVRRALDGETVPSLAAAVGIDPGPPVGVYHDLSDWSPDRRLAVDREAAAGMVAALVLGDRALREFGVNASEPVLWPEHLDVAITLDEVNYGVSPGDGYSAEPYAYVGPHGFDPAATDAFFDAPFGAARPVSAFSGVDDLVEFFRTGRDAAGRRTS